MDDRLLSLTISIRKPSRRSLRFSLCTWLLLTVIAGIWLGLGGQHWATMQRMGSVREPAASRSVVTGIPRGLRVISVALALPTPAVQPGDRVSLGLDSSSQVVVDDVTVFSVDSDTSGERRVVSFLLEPDEAKRIMASSEQGRLTMSIGEHPSSD